MHIIEPEQSSIADSRVSAMHDRDPIHTMLYDSKGMLLSANKAAMSAFHIDTPGNHTRCTTWLKLPALHCILVSWHLLHRVFTH